MGLETRGLEPLTPALQRRFKPASLASDAPLRVGPDGSCPYVTARPRHRPLVMAREWHAIIPAWGATADRFDTLSEAGQVRRLTVTGSCGTISIAPLPPETWGSDPCLTTDSGRRSCRTARVGSS